MKSYLMTRLPQYKLKLKRLKQAHLQLQVPHQYLEVLEV